MKTLFFILGMVVPSLIVAGILWLVIHNRKKVDLKRLWIITGRVTAYLFLGAAITTWGFYGLVFVLLVIGLMVFDYRVESDSESLLKAYDNYIETLERHGDSLKEINVSQRRMIASMDSLLSVYRNQHKSTAGSNE